MKTCPFCAEEIQDAAIFCRFCGRELATAGTHVAVSSPPVASSPPKWALGALVLSGILTLVGNAAAGAGVLLAVGWIRVGHTRVHDQTIRRRIPGGPIPRRTASGANWTNKAAAQPERRYSAHSIWAA